ncbi:MAG: arsenite methyltransferase [Prolixibacteraceae bacterium]|nr:arsenite methyltransferase [Prolixibacteraceae bacterium]MBT6764947.1 arsenite methyltransferase [Prolixibacteraceae bacterium]MBT6997399.1 arsenite methyltransferase [Prolixibacteraceae bacterium]MBT7396610.1 arsenite methyltransferase [Prolixibacteraceae bacterium]
MKAEDLKFVVRKKYGEIASQSIILEQSSCCGKKGCSSTDYTVFNDDYSKIKGYNPDADLQLGCGIPTKFAGIELADNVLDLGSGAGNDCFIARSIVGKNGKVTGLDFTVEMMEKANENLNKTNFKNIEFVQGDIENIPLPDNLFDVVISNCVLNLVPDKEKAFSEIYRVLKHSGHFCISDVVLSGTLPKGLQEDAEMYAGCVSGALQKEDYLGIIQNQGFSEIKIHNEKKIVIPDHIKTNYLSEKELNNFKKSKIGIYSITVTANKSI